MSAKSGRVKAVDPNRDPNFELQKLSDLINFIPSESNTSTGQPRPVQYTNGLILFYVILLKYRIEEVKGIEKEKGYLYADEIHYNNQGQKFLCNILYPYIPGYFN